MSRLCRDSEWPLSHTTPTEVSTEFHVDRYCRWLLCAGADPRLSVVFCAGADAKQDFIDGVRACKVIPEMASATRKQPVASNLARHQGTHFNSTLFIMDGLETLDRDAFNTLNGQRGLLNRMATWVAVVVEDMDTLCRLYQFSDGLMRDVMRRLLVVSGALPSEPQGSAPADHMNQWRRSARVAEIAFHTVMTHAEIAGYDDVSRLLRTGYGLNLNPLDSPTWTPWQRIWHGADPGVPMSLDLASAVARHLPGFSHSPEIAKVLENRPMCAASLKAVSSGLPALLNQRTVVDLSGWVSQVRAVTENWIGRDAERAVVELYIAERYASIEDVAGCQSALKSGIDYARHPSCPEVFFELATFVLKLKILLGERKEARLILTELEALGPELHSPFYDARIHLARGDYRGPLDRAPALAEYESALRIFSKHGYLRWAETARERITLCT